MQNGLVKTSKVFMQNNFLKLAGIFFAGVVLLGMAFYLLGGAALVVGAWDGYADCQKIELNAAIKKGELVDCRKVRAAKKS